MNQVIYELLIKIIKQIHRDFVDGAIKIVFENGHLKLSRNSENDQLSFCFDCKLVKNQFQISSFNTFLLSKLTVFWREKTVFYCKDDCNFNKSNIIYR